ncbi:aldo/keto reductase [Sphingobium nicotianae]|uniref:Aldo/keto reductase n=1 Tax=Sphingobium nicotianae TaxID=2782607 RepID=A0A9X1DB37_9SPHN|nr:aldo/keto reductase [Sphingobium nicotianae]MBT2186716.1 aldo/keto reductase [Sphingobium nicotianae]
MRYNHLGQTGLIVSELCLGAMTFGTVEGRFSHIAGLEQEAASALVRQAFDAGVNFIDTANVYSDGQSETLTGAALRQVGIARRDAIVATKAFARMGTDPNHAGNSRKHLMDEIDASLKRLGMDYVDLYQVHGFDPQTPIEETLRALDDIVRSGRARYVGVSNWAGWQVAKAQGIAGVRGLERIASIQSYYTLAGRDLEREIVPMMQSEGVGLMVWSPLAGGLLSGKYSRTDAGEGRGVAGEGRVAKSGGPADYLDMDKVYALIDLMRPMAEGRGIGIASIALAWLLQRPFVSSVIVGATRPEQLAQNLAASDVALTPAEIAALDEASALGPEYPGWMFPGQLSRRGGASPRRPAPLG